MNPDIGLLCDLIQTILAIVNIERSKFMKFMNSNLVGNGVIGAASNGLPEL